MEDKELRYQIVMREARRYIDSGHSDRAVMLLERMDVTGIPLYEGDGDVAGEVERFACFVADVRSHVRGTQDGPDTYPTPAHGWTCFHCGETFRTLDGAVLHFGAPTDDRPVCVVAVQPAVDDGLNPGDVEPHDDVERTLRVVKAAYGWTLDVDGRLCGLVAGDMGYESTHIVIDLDDLPNTVLKKEKT